jgi:3D (Asp-Asp-Asp) domain-containing protein
MGHRPFAALILAVAVLAVGSPAAPGVPVFRPRGLPADWEAKPLGWVRVTRYTHVETHSRLTSSGYVLKDSDENRVCAVSRDWWRSRVKPGDLVWVEGVVQPCVALDTMALTNSKGLAQTRWIDVYTLDPGRALDFGIRHANAYLVRPLTARKSTPASADRRERAR